MVGLGRADGHNLVGLRRDDDMRGEGSRIDNFLFVG